MTSDPALARRATTLALAAFAFLSIFFTGVFPRWSNPNELSRFQTVVAMAEWKTFSIDQSVALLGDHEDKSVSDGRLYSNKAPGLAFASYPIYRILRVVLPLPKAGTAAIFYFTRLLTVSLVCLIALRRFAARLAELATSPAAAPLVTLAVALGTPFLYYARSFFSHAWTAALLFLAWDRLRRAEDSDARGGGAALAALAGFLAAWAAISEYSVAPVALVLGLRALAGRSGRRFVAFGLGAAVPLALLSGYDAVCFGSAWTLSSAREAAPEYAELAGRGVFGFHLPSARIALAYLVDPARGVFLFSPFLLWSFLGLARWWKSRLARADWWCVAGALAALFVSLCGYPNWHGGWSLGSRYLLPGVLFAALPIARALDGPVSRGLFVAATVFSVASHFLLTSAWPHFPLEMPWPAATGSWWFLARGWVAPSLLTLAGAGPAVALLPALLVTLWALAAASRAAAPVEPALPVALLVGVAPLCLLLLRPPEPPYFGRLWRAGVLGAFSGRDDGRQELGAVVLEADTPEEKRMALGVWRRLGPPTR